MLGNFSIGDYFKKFAVEQAWELVTSPDGFGFDPDKLWATVYRGDGTCRPTRRRSRSGWRSASPPERILRLGGDNFCRPARSGRAGPCSELHYDRGRGGRLRPPECGPDCDCDRFIEFWNLVFMQYNMLDDGSLEPLPRPSIDTGAGLERVTMLAAGRRQRVPDRRLRRRHRGDRGLERRPLRAHAGRDEGAQGARRPRPGHELPRERRDRAGERRARLRPASRHPAGDPVRPPDRA